MTNWEPIYTVRDIVDVMYPQGTPQEEKNYLEKAACSKALQKMELTDRLMIEQMADDLSTWIHGLGRTSAVIILFRIGAYLYANGRRR